MSTRIVVDAKKLESSINGFLSSHAQPLNLLDKRVSRIFETFAFAQLIKYYDQLGWTVSLKNLSNGNIAVLKASTRGKPADYTYARCEKNGEVIEIRNQLKVNTAHSITTKCLQANICLDVAVIKGDLNLPAFNSESPIPNCHLLFFGEVKHLPAFSELMASFVGIIHEMLPGFLNGTSNLANEHLPPFLFVSGNVQAGAAEIGKSMTQRSYTYKIFHMGSDVFGNPLPSKRWPE